MREGKVINLSSEDVIDINNPLETYIGNNDDIRNADIIVFEGKQILKNRYGKRGFINKTCVDHIWVEGVANPYNIRSHCRICGETSETVMHI